MKVLNVRACKYYILFYISTQGACSFASEVIGLMPGSQVLPGVSSPPRGPASPTARHTAGMLHSCNLCSWCVHPNSHLVYQPITS